MKLPYRLRIPTLLFSGLLFASVLASPVVTSPTIAAEVSEITPDSHPHLGGKEVDWIYGDYTMHNDLISLTIAAPLSTRDANLTVRDIGASILDLTLNDPSNDQLSAFIPTAGRYYFHDPALVESGSDDNGAYWRCRSSSSATNDGTTATVTYRLGNSDAFVTTTVSLVGEKAPSLTAYDGIRADKTFQLTSLDGLAVCRDTFFRQTIGIAANGTDPDAQNKKALTWKNGRPSLLNYDTSQVTKSDGELSWSVRIYPATSTLDLQNVIAAGDENLPMQTFRVVPNLDAFDGENVMRAELSIKPISTVPSNKTPPFIQTDDHGVAHTRLMPGQYQVTMSAIGFAPTQQTITVGVDPKTHTIAATGFSGFIAKINDGNGRPIPAKATIYALSGDAPDFGPDSTRTFVKNCVYSVHGHMRCPLPPGKYEVYFSHGPEFDRVIQTIQISAEQTQSVNVQLKRVVDTTGWVSTELHSHSSPSGDNVSDQYGRVENLLCEHLEFAPCTEHNRISSYQPHLQQMQLSALMATCSGMELTGRLLPVNHQNAFPLHHHPHTQNGGGPRVDDNPVVQIERLAMWDRGSEKLIQTNHPNLHQIYGDLDVDGKPDGGFRGMLQWMDVIEVHPLQTVFENIPDSPPDVREMRIPLFQWLQLLNQGIRIPGVVNTDAHYNHHGSGSLRNWFASSTDDPAEISTAEMIRQAEAGHIIMSTGPFLSVTATSASSKSPAIPGDNLLANDGKVTLSVKVQCPNWLDVNRVQILVNGRRVPEHNRTRKTHGNEFGKLDDVTKFDSTFEIQLDHDAHLIVATIGEGMSMEKVMGTQNPPIAVSNPIYIDIDDNGFQPNGDGLGLPLPGEH
ncbi:CehA/McbA family metallohydrolase [Stieleria varia]|uniref:Carboxypeptidase regulatory-like domain-containing protein n=1 Tax=Stieleria varia TaxID=2528005 RepID=A0A5C6ARR0_9BACT|nr:CehA/McbA family metallohydrolase [Stieleria varia]TWU00854.1 hypothetical protein Pla52n_42230 [Stieleria varia]